MSEIVVDKFDDNVLRAGNICYALYKRYPNGFRFFLGHFRTKYDYDAEVEWLDAHEKDPEEVYYVAKEVSDWKLKNICDSAKYAEKLKARVKERWEAKQKANKEYKEWKAELVAKGMTESDLPLSKRKCLHFWVNPPWPTCTTTACSMATTWSPSGKPKGILPTNLPRRHGNWKT